MKTGLGTATNYLYKTPLIFQPFKIKKATAENKRIMDKFPQLSVYQQNTPNKPTSPTIPTTPTLTISCV